MLETFERSWFLFGLVAPALITLIALLLAVQPGRPGLTGDAVAAGWSAGIGGAMLLGIAATFGPPDVPPGPISLHEIRWQDWLWLVVALAGGIELCSRLHPMLRRLAWPARLMLIAAAPWLILQPIIRQEWTSRETAGWMIALVGGLLALLLAGRVMDRSRPGRDLPITLGLAAGAMGATIAMSGSQRLGQLGMTLCAALAGGCVIAICLPRAKASSGAATLALLMYGIVLMVGYHYTYDTYTDREGLLSLHVLLFASGPVLGALASLPTPRLLGLSKLGALPGAAGIRGAIRGFLIVAPAAAAAALAYTQILSESGSR